MGLIALDEAPVEKRFHERRQYGLGRRGKRHRHDGDGENAPVGADGPQ
jgi:hypothetical protein